ncbi:MAG: dihydropteroate synthase [Desulfuromonas sp.]|nr:MAG: dihydropteroate synthase [Desulfuromonas sp.]
MGVLNVTPDSFSDGGRYLDADSIRERIESMVDEGVDLIDIGGESSRPGALPVSIDEELARVVPAVEAAVRLADVPVSIDTTKADVARAAVEAGAAFVNDISGLHFDPDMAAVVAGLGAGLFVMHTRGRPDSMQSDTTYRDIMTEISAYLDESLTLADNAGVPITHIAVDPGIGFGKSVEGNLEILRRLRELRSLGRPILLGTSRKSFIGKVLHQDDPARRLAGSLASIAMGVAAGARIFRVHDVGPSREAATVAWAISSQGSTENRESFNHG